MAEVRLYANPNDIIQLSGTSKIGRVLGWGELLPIDQRQHAETHYPVQPIDAAGRDEGPHRFWPMNGVAMVKRFVVPQPYRADEFDVKF